MVVFVDKSVVFWQILIKKHTKISSHRIKLIWRNLKEFVDIHNPFMSKMPIIVKAKTDDN